MIKQARPVAAGLATIVVAGIAVALFTYLASEAHLRSSAPERAEALMVASRDDDAVARGRQLALTRGCHDCHGERLEGAVFHDAGWLRGRFVAPNLAKVAREISLPAFATAVRRGVGSDGRALYAMPSFNFARLTGEDVAAVYRYLRAAPVVEASLPRASLGPLLRWDLATGQDHAMPRFVADVPALRGMAWGDPAVARGEYLAMTSCNECHGLDLRGKTPFGEENPDLVLLGSYSEEEFRELMRTGRAAGGRPLNPLMSGASRRRFVHWTDEELTDLYAFFQAFSREALEPASGFGG